jgi:hypothetical protein
MLMRESTGFSGLGLFFLSALLRRRCLLHAILHPSQSVRGVLIQHRWGYATQGYSQLVHDKQFQKAGV